MIMQKTNKREENFVEGEIFVHRRVGLPLETEKKGYFQNWTLLIGID